MQQLKEGSTLQGGKYKILKVLGQGGFGITYLAENTMLEGQVAIKEFFFKEYCDRDEQTSHVTIGTASNREIVARFKQKFLKEARTIFRLNHPNIVRLLDVFEENDTAYYVMEYIEGGSLGELVQSRGALPEQESVRYIKKVGAALSYIHGKKMNHLDIKPGNIMKRREDGQIVVIDFGVAKQYDIVTSEGTTTTPVGISHGYSPAEQYRKNGVQSFSPQSDVYALAATLFKLLTGVTPPEPMEIADEGLPMDLLQVNHVSSHIIATIQKAMKGQHERTQSVEEFLTNLDNKALAVEETRVLVDKDSTLVPVELVDDGASAKAEERKAKEEAERRAREEALRKQKEAEAAVRAKEAAVRAKAEEAKRVAPVYKPKEKKSSKAGWWIAVGIVLVVLVVVGVVLLKGGHKGKPSGVNQDSAESVSAQPESVTNKAIVLDKGPESKRSYTYTGEVDEDGLPDGQGMANFPKTKSSSSCTFVGTFSHGLTKEGEMTFSSGAKYKGTFTDGGFYDKGTWWETDGYYFVGTFKNADPYNGTWYTPEGKEDSKVVYGK